MRRAHTALESTDAHICLSNGKGKEFLKVSGGWFKRSSERIAELVSACLLNVVDVLTTLVFKASFSPSEAT